MQKPPDQWDPEFRKALTEVQPTFYIVHSPGLADTENAAKTETVTARLGDLRHPRMGPLLQECFRRNSDVPVTLRIFHRYPKTIKPSDISLCEAGSSSEEKPTPDLTKEGNTWSSALFDLKSSLRASRLPTVPSPETVCNEDGFIDLNRFCHLCQPLCEKSRIFNTYIYEEDATMPMQEPPDSWQPWTDMRIDLPHSEIREYFDFWPSSAEMLASARSGCHLCTIICQLLIERLDWNIIISGGTESSPTSGPVKLVVCWTWWHPTSSLEVDPLAPWNFPTEASVGRALYLQWPLRNSGDDAPNGPCFLSSQVLVPLDISVDATRDRNQVLAELQSTCNRYRFDSWPGSWHYYNEANHQVSPSIGNGMDHLLSHYTGSQAVLNLAHRWISACHTEHSCHKDPTCPASGVLFRPTRLLDVGDSDGMQDPRLNIKRIGSGPIQYLALSHCWGCKSDKFYKLTTENEEELLQGVQTTKLSQTFQDAVKVCRKLKMRYIWIDSLCIKQDDADDWIREAAQMHLIYANSYCTIGAVCASGGEEGFLRSRNPLGMELTQPRDRPFAFQGITSYIARLSSKNASRGGGSGVSFFDGLPVPFLLPSLLWMVACDGRLSQNITKSGTETLIVAECYVNTLSWASVEGHVRFPCKWPICTAATPKTAIFAPGLNSGTFALRKRTQVIELFPCPKPCETVENDDYGERRHIPGPKSKKKVIPRYRYCTRVVSLIHVHHLLSRVTLEGPTFSFTTTPSTCGPKTFGDGGYMVHSDHPDWDHGPQDRFAPMSLDLACLRTTPRCGLVMQVTCLTVIEWEWDRDGGPEIDMAAEDPDCWQPNSAAGIVLIRSKSGEECVHWDKGEEIYTRIGYWELAGWNRYHPRYGPIREKAKVRRVTVI